MARETNQLPEKLLATLREGVPALLITAGEDGLPHTAFTFVAATRPNYVAVVIDEGSATLANIERTQQASVQILAPDNQVFLLKGQVRISESKLKSSPVPSRRAEIELSSVKNQAWPTVVVSPLRYAYAPQARSTWESAVAHIYAELRGEWNE